MRRLLVFVDWFLPGYKAGGQVQSCANLAFAIQDEIEVFIVTSDRDLGDNNPYPSITQDAWNDMGKVRVRYISPQHLNYATIKSIIAVVKPECVYLNSMFSFHFTIMALMACVYNKDLKTKVVLAPRGMLHQGALQFKWLKKQFFLKAFRVLQLQKRIVFHATDKKELEDIRKVFGPKAVLHYVNDFPTSQQFPLQGTTKETDILKCIFVSRISPKKNLLFLLEVLQQVKSNIELTIAGPVEDEAYWKLCMHHIKMLPDNIKVEYVGAKTNYELNDLYRMHHLFILLTHGENFGHVIFESLINGRPVLISDQTPWTGLNEKGIGWDLPLKERELIINSIEEAALWNQQKFDSHCFSSWHFACQYILNNNLKRDYLHLFDGEEVAQQ